MARLTLMHSEISLHKDLNESTKIYHIYKLKHFEYLLNRKKLYLNKIKDWKDPYELPYKAFGPEVRVKNGHIQKDGHTDEEFSKIVSDPIIAEFSYMNEGLINYSQAMCFDKELDIEAMWEKYSKDDDGSYGVCVETTIGDFIESVQKQYDSLFVGPVQYFDFLENPKLLLLNDQRKFYPRALWMGFIKRVQYEYENEIRFIFNYNIDNSYVYQEDGEYKMRELNIDTEKYIHKIILAPEFDKNKDKCEIINDFRNKYKVGDIKVEMSKLYDYKKFELPVFTEKEISRIINSSPHPQNAKSLYIRYSEGNFVKLDR